MSAISTTHQIKSFATGMSALEGNVLIISRGNKKSNTVSICASLPPVDTEAILDNFELLVPHIKDLLESVQSKIIRTKFAAGKEEVTTDEVSVTGCIDYMNQQAAETSRLSKESISEYLNSIEQKEALKAAFSIALKYGDNLTSEQEAKLNQMQKAFADTITELSGSRTYWEEKKQNSARKYLEQLEDSPIKDRLISRLDAMKDKKLQDEASVLDALGF